MVSLADFNKPTETNDTLATFAGGGVLDTGKPVNQDTITNMAAHAAVLAQPDQVGATYSAVHNELGNTGASPTLDTLRATRQTQDDTANLAIVRSAMSDPNMSVADKTAILSGYTSMQNSPVSKSLGAQVATQAAMAPSSPTDNDETESTRIDVVKNMDEVDAYTGWVSQQSNNIRRMRMQNGFDSTVDVLETLVPFMSQGSQAQISAALANPDPQAKGMAIVKAMALTGESKKGLADAVSAMPIDQRMEFAQKLVDLVKSSNGSMTTRPNELNMINDIQDALTSGQYSGSQRMIDNIASVLDMTIIAGPAWKGAEGFIKGVAGIGKAASNAADIARADEAITRLSATTEEAIQTAKEPAAAAQATPVAEGVPDVFQTPPEALPRVPEAVDTTTPKSVSKPTVFEPQTQPARTSGVLDKSIQNQADFEKAYSQVTDVGNLPATGEVGNQASFEKAYGDVTNVGDLPATGEVGNQNAFEKAYDAAHPITEDTAAGARQIILDNIHRELTDLGASASVIEDAKASVAKRITAVSLSDPTLPKQITDSMRGVFRRAGAAGIDPAALKRVREYVDAQSTVERRVVRTDVDFASVSQRVKDVNPEKARTMLDTVIADPTGNVAKALYGTSKEEAIANDVLPEIAEEGGTVRGKYSLTDDAAPTPDQAFIRDQQKVRGDIHFSPAEKAAMRNTVASDLDSVVGLTPRREMNTIGGEPYTPKIEANASGVSFDQVFGPKDGGFADPKQALTQVKFALKKYGIRDDEIELLKRDAQGNFSPVKRNEGISKSEAPKGWTSVETSTIDSISVKENSKLLSFTKPDDLADYIASTTRHPLYKDIAERVKPFLKDVKLENRGSKMFEDEHAGANGLYWWREGSTDGKLKADEGIAIKSPYELMTRDRYEETFLHEAIHASINSQIHQGIKDLDATVLRGGKLTTAAKLVNELEGLKLDVQSFIKNNLHDPSVALYDGFYATKNLTEFPTFGLTNRNFQNMLRKIKYNNGTVWDKFVDVLRNALHLSPKHNNALDKIFSISDRLFQEPKSLIGSGSQGVANHIDAPGEYLVRVKHDYLFSPADTQSWSLLSPNKFWKMFDALPTKFDLKMGGIMEHLIPPVNINDSLLTSAASNASDQAARIYKGLEKLGKDYAAQFMKLETKQKNYVSRYILRANSEGIPFNPIAMKGVGFSDDAVEAVRLWKRAQDTNWHFENIDLNKTLHSLGWERYVDQTGNSDLVVKRVGPNAIGRGERILDGNGRLVQLNDKELGKLYDDGGTIAKLRRPIEKDGEVVEHIVVKGNAEDSYLRRIREDDATLTYRDGYYAVRYKDPYFITKTMVGQNGQKISKAVATAGNRLEANSLLERLKATDIKGEYNLRDDVKKDPTELDDFKWDQIVNSGRSPQRLRGELLTNASPTVTDLAHAHIESPEESLIASIRSLSNRMAMRDYLQAAKQRWMSQFAHTLKGQDVQGFPDSVTMIAGRTKLAKLGDVASAKVSWRYINAMENGYVNLLDDLSKSFFNEMSDVAGRSKSMAVFEKPLRHLGEVGPASGARKLAFRMTLAANPLRQFPVQALQALPTMISTNPLAIPKVANQLVLLHGFRRGLNPADMGVWLGKFTGLDGQAASDLFEHWKMAGFENAVNANSLIRDDLTTLTDRSLAQKIGKVAGTPLDIAQKFGFQAGENALMDVMWLSEYDLLKKSGRRIDAESLAMMNARIRDLTGNMNKAGEMPYNENALSFIMQFAQAGHKAFATMLVGHKGLSTADRVRLGASSIIIYGVGADAVNYATSLVDKVIPDNWPGKGVLKDGLFDLILNTTLSNVFHENVDINFSDSLRQIQFPNLFTFWQGMMQSDPGKILQSTPSGSLIGRMGNVVREMSRPFTSSSDRNPEQAAVIGKAFLSLYSGLSNYYKAQYIMEHHKIMTSAGKTVDFHSNDVEGWARLAGFSSTAELQMYAFQENEYRMSQEPLNDVKYFISETSKHLALKGITTDQTQYFLTMLGEAQLKYKGDPFYMRLFDQQLAYGASKGEATIFNSVMKMIGYHSKQDIQSLLDNSPLSEDQKATLLRAAEAAEGNYTNGK